MSGRALAHAVAIRVIGYRVDHGLSQSGLARVLGMHQPAIARPKLMTASRRSLPWPAGESAWSITDIAPDVFELRGTA
jgi:hypothetical protein